MWAQAVGLGEQVAGGDNAGKRAGKQAGRCGGSESAVVRGREYVWMK